MKSKKVPWILFAVLPLFLAGGYSIFSSGRPAPVPVKEEIMEGVTYQRIVR